ncbi:hypothetical protein A9Q86_12630 [Flavobacteriales bacterium 33_180_T64]|nr:hypothetical protein A9Q86_12630 [Flavobacteriales bacterium 33_180_T64]
MLLIIGQTTLSAQNSVNDYKYIVIPAQYEFLKSHDQYQLNSLTKFLFNKYGFTAFIEDENLPEDLSQNRCLALKSNVEEVKGGLLKTKLQINLIDCRGRVVMSSKIGETKIKEYKKAYSVALRQAFETYQFLNYKYKPSEKLSTVTTMPSEVKESEAKKEIERLKKEVEALKEKKKESAKAVSVPEVDVVKSSEKEVKIIKAVVEAKEDTNMLYAQPIDNGFQIVNTIPEKVMVLFYSGLKDVFIVEGKDAIVYKKGTVWVLAENVGASLKSETITIKF